MTDARLLFEHFRRHDALSEQRLGHQRLSPSLIHFAFGGGLEQNEGRGDLVELLPLTVPLQDLLGPGIRLRSLRFGKTVGESPRKSPAAPSWQRRQTASARTAPTASITSSRSQRTSFSPLRSMLNAYSSKRFSA